MQEHEAAQVIALELVGRLENYARWVAWLFRKHARGKVLEAGAGLGWLTRRLKVRELVVTDADESRLRALKGMLGGRATVLRWDVREEAPRELGRSYDAVVSSNLLEHLDDDAGAARRMVALLRPGGRLALFAPAQPVLYNSADRALGHRRRYTKASLLRLLKESGLRTVEMRELNLVGGIGWFLNGLLSRENLPACASRAFDALVPVLALAEAVAGCPWGLSAFAVGVLPRR